MFFPRQAGKLIGIVVGGTALVGVIIWLSFGSIKTPATNTTANQNIDVARQEYGDLYQAAWRQDTGRGNVLMTATLFAPRLVELLGNDTGKSEAENQLYQAVKDIAGNEVALFLTIDSVNGGLSDAAIKDSLSLTADGFTFALSTWKPFIFPSRIVNTDVSATSQTGLAIFSANKNFVWASLTNLQLTSKNLGDLPTRSFIWTDPALLQAQH